MRKGFLTFSIVFLAVSLLLVAAAKYKASKEKEQRKHSQVQSHKQPSIRDIKPKETKSVSSETSQEPLGVSKNPQIPTVPKKQKSVELISTKIPPVNVLQKKLSYQFSFTENNKRFALSNKTLRHPNDRAIKAGILFDKRTGKLLWAKNTDQVLSIASLTKVLTVLTTLKYIEGQKDISRRTKLPISKTARSVAFSKFLRLYPNKEVPVLELMQSAMVKSANDSTQLLAEKLMPKGEAEFVRQMNLYAASVNMKKTRVFNAHGLPSNYAKKTHADNRSTVKDLARLTLKVYDYPEIFTWTRRKSLTLPKGHKRAVFLNNTNPLINITGVQGLKTGYTDNAGSCLIFTYKGREGDLVGIVLGCASKKDRDPFSRAILNWGKKAVKLVK